MKFKFVLLFVLLAVTIALAKRDRDDKDDKWKDAVDDAKEGRWRECARDSKKAAEKTWDRWRPSNMLPSFLRPSNYDADDDDVSSNDYNRRSWFEDWKEDLSLQIPSSLRDWKEPDWFKRQRSSAYAVDLWEDDNAFHLHAELPGMKMDSIKLEVDGKILILTADREERYNKQEDDSREWFSRERASGKYRRRFVLPENVVLDGAKATYNNGVLEVVIPKTARKKMSIPISRLPSDNTNVDTHATVL